MLNRRSDKLELLRIAEAVALEKSIDKELIINSMETGIAKAAKSKFGEENEIKVIINRENGDIGIFRSLKIVENPENLNTEISLDRAAELDTANKDKKIGDEVLQTLPSFDFGRIAAQTAKQVISFNVREAERDRQYNEFVDKKDTIVSGIVKRLEFGNIIVDLSRAEGIINKNETIPREVIKAGDRVKAYLYNVNQDTKGPQIFLSRTHPQFLSNLFKQEVPEISDNIIEIKSVARDPGSRAKIAVYSSDKTIDPVGACVGMRGSRVQAVVTELQGEKIDIVTWAEDKATYIVNSLAPAQISKVIFEEETDKIKVIIPEDQLSLAIGRKGQNVRLASILTNCEIDIIDEKDEKNKRNEEVKKISETFMKELDVDEVIAHLLATEGFTSIEEIGQAVDTDFKAIEGFDENLIKDLKDRAIQNLSKKNKELEKKKSELNISKELENIKKFSLNDLIKLGENNIKKLDDLANLSSDELLDIFETTNLKKKDADEIIMKARESWFKEDKKSKE